MNNLSLILDKTAQKPTTNKTIKGTGGHRPVVDQDKFVKNWDKIFDKKKGKKDE